MGSKVKLDLFFAMAAWAKLVDLSCVQEKDRCAIRRRCEMRSLLLAYAVLILVPGISFAQRVADRSVVRMMTAEESQAFLEEQMVLDESERTLEALEAERIKDPEYRRSRVADARLLYEKMLNVRNNPGYAQQQERSETLQLFEMLQLSGMEYEKLLDLLAEFEVEDNILRLESGSDFAELHRGITPAGRAAATQWLQKIHELPLKREESIATLLGPARYELWQRYRKNREKWFSGYLPENEDRTEVFERLFKIQRILAKARQPLTEPQVKPMVEALMAGVRHEGPASGPRYDERPSSVDYTEVEDELGLHIKLNRRIRENHKGILNAVAPYLTELQLAVVRAGFDSDTK
jgi:hypothetical protein